MTKDLINTDLVVIPSRVVESLQANYIYKTPSVTARVDLNGCYVCTSHTPDRNGYIRLCIEGEYWLAHRYLWNREYGSIPENMTVTRTCGNRRCLNIQHYILQGKAEIAAHMRASHKGPRGKPAKLTAESVREIRSRYPGVSITMLSREYGVDRKVIYDVVRRFAWKHVVD